MKKNVKRSAATYLIGRVDHVSAAYAYVVPQDETQSDVWVRQENLLGALHRDIVKVRIHKNGKNSRVIGSVVTIVEPSNMPIVGRLAQYGGQHWVTPDGRRMHQDILIDPTTLQEGQVGDKVIIKITDRPQDGTSPRGTIERVLGPAGQHEVELHAIMAEFGLPTDFPEAVMHEAAAIATDISAAEVARRRDFRGVPTMTIDPDDAKDFDDALSLQQLPNGRYEVGIHIADVSHYVQPGSTLDQEALGRATSVYLVDRTVPMLPEKLSNELCSLRPQEEKLTFSAVFELDAAGNIHNEWVGETVIYSDKRFTYEEAQQVIDQQKGLFCQELTLLNQLAKQLRTQRFQQGAMNFETTEIKFALDAEGKPLSIVPKVRKDTHKLVEEFMLLANARVATRVAKMQPDKNLPTFVYRTHDDPDPDKLDDFWMFVKHLGYPPRQRGQSISQALNAATAAAAGHTTENLVQSLAIRSMAKALYTTEAKGHFGLALPYYTHFTSPIRRYPDIMVHRLLKQYLQGHFQADARAYEAHCRHALERERLAAEAERASIRYKQVEWIQALQGQVMEGVISGLTEWGIYIELVGQYCEGMVRLADMKDDYYVLDEGGFRIVGRRSKKSYQLGDVVQVRVQDCDLTRRTVTLGWAEAVTERKKTRRKYNFRS